jgi:addiction module RelE/StbE family toxin
MYTLTAKSKRVAKQFYDALMSRKDIPEKLEMLRDKPREEIDAHKLKGRLQGKWGCSLGYDLRMIYEIDDKNKEILVFAVGTHKEVMIKA